LNTIKRERITTLKKRIEKLEGQTLILEKGSQSSSREEALKNLTSKVIISLDNKRFDKKVIDSLFTEQLSIQNLSGIDHTLLFQVSLQKDSLVLDKSDIIISSNSNLLPIGTTLQVGFTNVTMTVLKRNLFGILLSIFLVSAVIACLLYLVKIIQQQKQLSVIKNDFISNITHEFNTPLSTINVAVESLLNFNKGNDPIKTKRYLEMSQAQVNKLRTMVGRILDLSTFEKTDFSLHKETINVSNTLEKLIDCHKEIAPDKVIYFNNNEGDAIAEVDPFHFENAIDNIIENAIKYGEAPITISFLVEKENLIISVKDEGSSLTKEQSKLIFERFYRVPKGNTHDVKGFGIGLFYSKTIIQKHGGDINVTTQPTTFKISIPYV